MAKADPHAPEEAAAGPAGLEPLSGRLRRSAKDFELPPSVQSMKNIRAIDAMNAAADELDRRPPPASETAGLENALQMTGCKDEADLIDTANVGQSLMERIASLTTAEGPFKGWMPADDPAEIVFDLVNHYEDERRLASASETALVEALTDAALQFRHYEQAHKAKRSAEGDAKADTNRRMAERCETALAAHRAQQEGRG